MHDLISDTANAFELMAKCLSVDHDTQPRPILWVLKKKNIFAKRQVCDRMDLVTAARSPRRAKLLSRKGCPDQISNMGLDLT